MRAERGFTLLEVLIAFAIAALALGVLFRTASGSLIAVGTAGRYEEAIIRARSHLAAIGHNAAVLAGDSEGDDGDGYRWHLRVTPVATAHPPQTGTGLLTPAVGAPPPPVLYNVSVAISWRDVGGTRQVELDTERMGIGDSDAR